MQTSSSSSMQRENRDAVIALSIVGDDVNVSVNGQGLPTPREGRGRDGRNAGAGNSHGGKGSGPPGHR